MWNIILVLLSRLPNVLGSNRVDEHIREARGMLEAPRAQVMILGTFHFAVAFVRDSLEQRDRAG